MFETLPGFREFDPDACFRRNFLFEVWRRAATAFGFREYDGPLLEPLELYTEKSGEEIVGQLFHFTDRGGRAVALRPEMTPTLARMLGARAQSMKRPIKWFAIAENFRYERPQKGRLRSHYQLNADIYGESGPMAEAELISLLCFVFRRLGLDGNAVKIRLSDRRLWQAFLNVSGLDSAVSEKVLGVVDKMERRSEAASLEALDQAGVPSSGALWAGIGRLAGIRDLTSLEEFFRELNPPKEVESMLAGYLAETRMLLGSLEAMGYSDQVHLDLGIVRGLAYYTGFVFEAFEASGEGRALAGGGRYDTLVERLGGPSLPAVGFGMGDVTLADALDSRGGFPEWKPGVDVCLVYGTNPEERSAALRVVSELRQAGLSVEFSLREAGLGRQFRDANTRGARFVVVLGEEERARGEAKIRRMETGVEESILLSNLAARLLDLVRGS